METTLEAEHNSVRMFVAMPGTSMGNLAKWNNPDEIKQLFYRSIQSELTRALGRDVELLIERDKHSVGPIYNSMYGECWDADIYIADLTGSNPNVYLELGARWALREKVTIVVSQNLEALEFNVKSSRTIEYSKQPELLNAAITSVVRAIMEDLASSKPDNPVRAAIDVVTISRIEHEQLMRDKARSALLGRELSQSYVSAGLLAAADDRLLYFQKAIEADPKYPGGWVAKAAQLRKSGNYKEAIAVATEGLKALPDVALLYGERGLALGKLDRIAESISELRIAVRLDPNSAELSSNLGGALRRQAFASAGAGRFHVPSAIEARACYAKAVQLAEKGVSRDSNDELAYAQGNVARLDFVLSNFVPNRVPPPSALSEAFRRLRELCREVLRANPNNFYRQFDLADSYLLVGEIEEATKLYRTGIGLVSAEDRAALKSASEPLRQYLMVRCGNIAMRGAFEAIANELDHAASLLEP